MELVLADFLERSLALKFDICTCQQCRQTMLVRLVTAFPPCYADSDSPRLLSIQSCLVKEHSGAIYAAIKKTIEYVSTNPPHPLEEDQENAFDHLLEQIRRDRGVDFSQYFRNILKRRFALRLVASGARSYVDYLRILHADPGEYEKLFNVLTINVSDFFRDPEVWKVIEKIIKELVSLSNRVSRPLTIWSAGCARGQEPYSLAMLVRGCPELTQPCTIHATDVDRGCLEIARKGEYNGTIIDKAIEHAEGSNSLTSVLDWFSLKGDCYCVSDRLKSMVKFQYLDLTSSPYISNADLILCRNVFIYFTKPLQEQILDKFYNALNQDGYLIIGKSETMPPEAKSVFTAVDPLSRIFRKKDVR